MRCQQPQGDFSECRSVIEQSYGIGLASNSVEAQSFLAGAPVFKADLVEIWAIGSLEAGYAASDEDGGDYDDDAY